jgi:hypothetical protein
MPPQAGDGPEGPALPWPAGAQGGRPASPLAGFLTLLARIISPAPEPGAPEAAVPDQAQGAARQAEAATPLMRLLAVLTRVLAGARPEAAVAEDATTPRRETLEPAGARAATVAPRAQQESAVAPMRPEFAVAAMAQERAGAGGPQPGTGQRTEQPAPRAELVPPPGGPGREDDDRLPVGEIAVLFVAVPVLAAVLISLL